jgi:hypothetical protein
MGPVGEAADVMTDGAKKYGQNEKWRDIPPIDHYNSLMRHLISWRSGVKRDEESGLNHLAHVLARVCLLMETDNGGCPENGIQEPSLGSPDSDGTDGATPVPKPKEKPQKAIFDDTSKTIDHMVEIAGNERRAIAYLLGRCEIAEQLAGVNSQTLESWVTKKVLSKRSLDRKLKFQDREWFFVWPDGFYCRVEDFVSEHNNPYPLGDHEVKCVVEYDEVGEPIFV